MSVRRLLVTVVVVGCLSATTDASAWQRRISGTAPGSEDYGFAGAVDALGDVLAAGRLHNAGTGQDFVVAKVAGGSGAELWRQTIRGTAPEGFDQAVAVAADWEGNVVAAGSTENMGTGRDFTVTKLAGADGAVLWRYVLSGTAAGSNDAAMAVAVDWDGHVVAVGGLENAGTERDFVVVKLHGATGELLWRYVVDGTAHLADSAVAVAIDWKGHVVAAGTTVNLGTAHDFTVVKLDGGSGAELWRRVVDGAWSLVDSAYAVVVDWAGHVVAAGFTQNAGPIDDFTVMRLDGSDGRELWRYVTRGSAPDRPNAATSIAIDGSGDVIAGGYTSNTGSGENLTVIKLDSDSGGERWRTVVDGGVEGFDRAYGVAVDLESDVLVAGSVTRPFNGMDIAVLKLARERGEERWRRIVDGGSSRDDVARALAVDADGNVAAVGAVAESGPGTDLVVLKLRGADGGDY